jgi:hypothetical protein
MFCNNQEEKKEDLELQRIDTPEEKKVWRSCCFGEINKDAMVFFTQVIILFSFLIFCCGQLVRVDSCEGQQLYSSLITLVLGILCPSPRIKRN